MGVKDKSQSVEVIEKPLENIPKYPLSLKTTKFAVNCS